VSGTPNQRQRVQISMILKDISRGVILEKHSTHYAYRQRVEKKISSFIIVRRLPPLATPPSC
jgi:hypothetical protein